MRPRSPLAVAVPLVAALLVGLAVGTWVVAPIVSRSPAASSGQRTPVPGSSATANANASGTLDSSTGASASPGSAVAASASPFATQAGSTAGTLPSGSSPATTHKPGSSPAAAPSVVTTGSSVDVPILYYHRVQAAPPELWYWPKAQQDTFLVDDTFPASLAAQLGWLAAHNYTTILPRDLADHWDTGKPLPAHPVILTFDDGFSNWRTTVLPMLEKHHMIAEFYVVVQNVGRSISWSDVKALAAAGNGIGAHDVHHVQLAGGGVTAASAATMRAEVEGARRDIAANTGVTPDSLAYVGGGYDATLMAIVKAAGYRTARAIDRGVVQSPAIRFRLHVSRIGWADDLSNRQAGTLIPGLPTFAKRISGQDPG